MGLGAGRPMVLIFNEKGTNYRYFQGLYCSFGDQNRRYRNSADPLAHNRRAPHQFFSSMLSCANALLLSLQIVRCGNAKNRGLAVYLQDHP